MSIQPQRPQVSDRDQESKERILQEDLSRGHSSRSLRAIASSSVGGDHCQKLSHDPFGLLLLYPLVLPHRGWLQQSFPWPRASYTAARKQAGSLRYGRLDFAAEISASSCKTIWRLVAASASICGERQRRDRGNLTLRRDCGLSAV
jgi:hypothetical protein